MPKNYVAMTAGTCVRCNGPIKVGDSFYFGQRKSRYHVTCGKGGNGNGGNGGGRFFETPHGNGNGKGAAMLEAKPVQGDIAEKLRDLLESVGYEPKGNGEKVERNVLEIRMPDGRSGEVEGQHPQFAKLAKVLPVARNVYLVGGPGSGKSTAPRILAEALGLPFYFAILGPQTSPLEINGFRNMGTGEYLRTQFRDWYEHGGIMAFDEIDNASGHFVSTLNTSLDNGYHAFPDKLVKRHPEAYLVVTANTTGATGPTRDNAEARLLPMAFRDRFAYLRWEYDADFEVSIARSIGQETGATWARYIIKLRAAAATVPGLRVTPRASYRGAELLEAGTHPREVLDMLVFRESVDAGTVDRLLAECPLPAIEVVS